MIDRSHQLSVTRQARLLGLSRASVYYTPQPVPDVELAIMRRIDELHLELPFAGSRMLRDVLRREAIAIGREHVRTLMRRMAITAIYQRPTTTQRHAAHPVFPYLRPRAYQAPNGVSEIRHQDGFQRDRSAIRRLSSPPSAGLVTSNGHMNGHKLAGVAWSPPSGE